MAEYSKYLKDNNGVHLISGLGSDDTLCGYALDAWDTEENGDSELQDTKERVVTCPDCITQILHCRGVKIK